MLFLKNKKNNQAISAPPAQPLIDDPQIIDQQHQLTTVSGPVSFWRQIRFFFFIAVGFELLILILSLTDNLSSLTNFILPALLFVFYIFSFFFLSIKNLVKNNFKKSFLSPLFLALTAGFTSAIMKAVWYFAPWVFYNLFLEPLFQMFWALTVVLIVNLIALIVRQLKKIIQYYKHKVRPDLNIN